MNNSAPCITRSIDGSVPGDQHEIGFGPNGVDLISDEALDLYSILINTNPGKPGGRIVFDSAGYATDEEAMTAMEVKAVEIIGQRLTVDGTKAEDGGLSKVEERNPEPQRLPGAAVGHEGHARRLG